MLKPRLWTSLQVTYVYGARVCMHESEPGKIAPSSSPFEAPLQGTDWDQFVWDSIPYGGKRFHQ